MDGAASKILNYQTQGTRVRLKADPTKHSRVNRSVGRRSPGVTSDL